MSLRCLNFNTWTTLRFIPIFILGLVLISSSIPFFNQESLVACPTGFHKTPSGDCQEGMDTEESPTPESQSNAQEDNQQTSYLFNNNSEFLTYEGPLYGFKIDYPSGAKPQENPNSVDFVLSHPANTDPSDVATLDIVNNIELHPGTTLDSFTRKLMSEARESPNQNLYNYTVKVIGINKLKISNGTEDANMVLYRVNHEDVLGDTVIIL